MVGRLRSGHKYKSFTYILLSYYALKCRILFSNPLIPSCLCSIFAPMLRKLQIQNYAIIDEVDIAFDPGLNIITGETGAGKSILLGALGLIMGQRADSKVLYNPDRKCVVEATFDIGAYDLEDFFKKEELDFDTELLVRREINASGKSRAFVNDTPVTLAIVSELMNYLIDMHRQFDTMDIHQSRFQIGTLDALAGQLTLSETYQKEFKAYQADKSKLADLKAQRDQQLQELDFVRFQLAELQEANLQSGELLEKEQLFKQIEAAEELQQIGQMIQHTLEENDQSIVSVVRDLLHEAGKIRDVSPKTSETYDRLSSLLEELIDVAAVYGEIAESTEMDPEQAAELEDRINLINILMQKHRVQDEDGLLAVQANLEHKALASDDLEEQIVSMEHSIAEQEKALRGVADKLSAGRKSASAKLVSECSTMLNDLAMPNAKLDIRQLKLEGLNLFGSDDIVYLFAADKGSKLQPIKEVASGGELARLALCLKSLVADAITLPTLIFDEIDTGVSGEVASKMGFILAQMSTRHQIIDITHSPQIAAKASKHFFVYKEDLEDRTITCIKSLGQEERIVEISKMLSGANPSEAAVQNAKVLLNT